MTILDENIKKCYITISQTDKCTIRKKTSSLNEFEKLDYENKIGIVHTRATFHKRGSNKNLFGYGRYVVLCTFVNGIFLVFIAFTILFESFDHVGHPPKVYWEAFTLDKCCWFHRKRYWYIFIS